MSKHKIIHFIHDHFDRHTYLIFLCALMAWIGFTPFLAYFELDEFFQVSMLSLINVSTFYFFRKSRIKYLILVMILIDVIAMWMDLIFNNFIHLYDHVRLLSLILFFLITLHLIKRIFTAHKVDEETIFASFSGYVMLGLMAAILCKMACLIYPGAYANIGAENSLIDFSYYTFVTMSTLGYGDILPLIPATKSLTIFITLTGQFYLTILVALLIGKYISNEKK